MIEPLWMPVLAINGWKFVIKVWLSGPVSLDNDWRWMSPLANADVTNPENGWHWHMPKIIDLWISNLENGWIRKSLFIELWPWQRLNHGTGLGIHGLENGWISQIFKCVALTYVSVSYAKDHRPLNSGLDKSRWSVILSLIIENVTLTTFCWMSLFSVCHSF